MIRRRLVRIRVYATLRDLMGGAVHDLPAPEGATVGDMVQRLVELHPALGEKLWNAEGRLTGYITVFLNGRSVEYLEGLATPVSERDALSLFPPVGGG